MFKSKVPCINYSFKEDRQDGLTNGYMKEKWNLQTQASFIHVLHFYTVYLYHRSLAHLTHQSILSILARPSWPGRDDPAEMTRADLTRGRVDPDSHHTTRVNGQLCSKSHRFDYEPIFQLCSSPLLVSLLHILSRIFCSHEKILFVN